jgi:hypothetical protein
MKISTVNQITVQDWNQLVETTYKKIYSFQQQDGCKDRGIVHISVPEKNTDDFEATEIPFEINGEEMGVSFETWLKTSPEDTAEHFSPIYPWENNLFWYRNFYPEVGMIVNDLHTKGLLAAGKYQILIDW